MFFLDKQDNKSAKENNSNTKRRQSRVNPHDMIRAQHESMINNSFVQKNDEDEKIQLKDTPLLQMTKKEDDEEIQMKQVSPVQRLLEDEEKMQLKKGSSNQESATSNISASVKLPEEVQLKMESSFGTNFHDVNIHKDDNSASQIGALAYTKGSDIHFAPGQYQPKNSKGQELIGHELTHVVQQRQNRTNETHKSKLGQQINSSPVLEQEADQAGKKVAFGENVHVEGQGEGIQRQEADTFTVPSGWGLNKIANHLGVSVEDLVAANESKLKTWGNVQGFNAGEVITIPGTMEPQKPPREIIIELYKQYINDEITMPDLARGLNPYAATQGAYILLIFNDLNWFHRDNLAYAMAANAVDTELSRFEPALLERMSVSLDTYLTGAREENLKQKERVDKARNIDLSTSGQGLQQIISGSMSKDEKASQIITYIRDQFTDYPPKVKAFKAQTNYTDDEKLRILGKLAALTGRIEILMGTIFYKGSNTANTWETQGANKGDDEFLGYYQTEKHGVANQGGEWCAMFVASVLNEILGFAPVNSEGERASQTGYGWVTWNVTSLHDSVTNHEGVENYAYDTRHAKKITYDNFNTLRTDILAEESNERKYQLVKSFFSNHFTPQAGDLLAVGKKTKEGVGVATKGLVGFNHSTMIEQLIDDKDNHKIYLSTVEGNADQRAGGRLIDLTISTDNSYNDLSFVTQVSRVSLNNHGVGPNINDATQDEGMVADSTSTWTEDQLVAPLEEMAYLLQNYAASESYLQDGNHSESIAQISEKDVSGSIN